MCSPDFRPSSRIEAARRDGRVAEGARLESVYTLTGIVGSNPTLSASFFPSRFQPQLIRILSPRYTPAHRMCRYGYTDNRPAYFVTRAPRTVVSHAYAFADRSNCRCRKEISSRRGPLADQAG